MLWIYYFGIIRNSGLRGAARYHTGLIQTYVIMCLSWYLFPCAWPHSWPHSHFVKNLIVLKGGAGQKERQQIAEMMDSIPEDEERLIIATGRYLGEGFDDARLDTLFLALPVSWWGPLSQYAGRLHRLHDVKKEVIIYDYVDLEVPVLVKMYRRRLAGYKAIGYEIQE